MKNRAEKIAAIIAIAAAFTCAFRASGTIKTEKERCGFDGSVYAATNADAPDFTLSVRCGDKTLTYEDKYIEPTDHDCAYEMRENKVNAGRAVKAAEAVRKVRSGKSKKRAVIATFPRLSDFFERVAKETYVAPRDSTISFTPNEAKKFVITPHKSGQKADERAFYADFYDALVSGKREITVKTESVEPEVTTADNAALTYLKSSFCTDYSRSGANRRRNVERAAEIINGTTLSGGEAFSFNRTVGRRTEQNGFYPAKIIVGGEYVEGMGGGVCQVSTTLYNAALIAGMNIEQAGSHSLAPSYVAPSFDAAVNYGSGDLVFVNGGKSKVFIRAYCADGKIRIEFYGERNRYKIVRKSVIVSQGAAPEDRIIEDTEGKYFAPEEESGALMRIRRGSAGLVSEGYLLYYDGNKCVKSVKIRRDRYMPVRGILVKKP